MNKKEGRPEKGTYRKYTIHLTDRSDEILEGLQKMVRESGGYRISKSELIRASIDLLNSAKRKIEWNDIRSEEDLIDRLKAAMLKI